MSWAVPPRAVVAEHGMAIRAAQRPLADLDPMRSVGAGRLSDEPSHRLRHDLTR